jgi:hypothetical protein
MPNWCDNRLHVFGEHKEIDRFMGEVFSTNMQGKQYLDFEKIVPIGDIEDWYTQRVSKWGTKWNLDGSDFDIDEEEGGISVWFLTAWTAPVPICRALTVRYPMLSFDMEYSEPGTGFRGWFEGEEGTVLQDACWDMSREELIELGYIDEEENNE